MFSEVCYRRKLVSTSYCKDRLLKYCQTLQIDANCEIISATGKGRNTRKKLTVKQNTSQQFVNLLLNIGLVSYNDFEWRIKLGNVNRFDTELNSGRYYTQLCKEYCWLATCSYDQCA